MVRDMYKMRGERVGLGHGEKVLVRKISAVGSFSVVVVLILTRVS